MRDPDTPKRLGPGARRRISETALELFSVHGVEGTSLQMIADRLGVAKAAVYYHFKTKDEILLGAAEPMLEEGAAFLDELEQIVDAKLRITSTIEGIVDFALRYRALLAPGANGIVTDQSSPDAPAAIAEFWNRIVRLLAGPDAAGERVIAAQVYLAGVGVVATGDFRSGYSGDQFRAALIAAGIRFLLEPVEDLR